MARFVLVHGGFHGGWAWERVAARLRGRGHEVHHPDLPGGGQDPTPLSEIDLERLGQALVETLRRCSEPPIVVGHSLGGLALTSAAEQRPDLIGRLVYLTALMLPNGAAVLPTLAAEDPTSEAAQEGALTVDQEHGTVTLALDRAAACFYNTCDSDDVEMALARVTNPVALMPFVQPGVATPQRAGRVPRTFIKTLRDQVLTPDFQQYMIDACGVTDVREIDTDHSPFFCAPGDLTEMLIELSANKNRPSPERVAHLQ
jgi:pimeloyl-ACP methyl ester carboxylesterase